MAGPGLESPGYRRGIAPRWVDAARVQLAELETGFTVEKAKVDALTARLFARLRAHFQRRDRLRTVINYRRKYLDFLVRHGEEDAAKVAQAALESEAEGLAKEIEELTGEAVAGIG